MQRPNLLEEYNRTMRRKLGHESLTEKLEAIRNGHGFRLQQARRMSSLAEAAEQATARPVTQG